MKAVKEALADAGIEEFVPRCRVGVCLGTTVASQFNNISFYDAYRRDGNPPLDAVYDYLNANLGKAVGDLLQRRRPANDDRERLLVGNDAIGVAASWIRAGLCDVALAGGADEMNRVALAGFWSLGVMSAEPCRPFDRDRAGLNLGEGAGIVVLESASHAQRRGKSGVRIRGFRRRLRCASPHRSASRRSRPDDGDQNRPSQADVAASQIAFVNAHGTATADNDRAEGKVIARFRRGTCRFSRPKGYTGHASAPRADWKRYSRCSACASGGFPQRRI